MKKIERIFYGNLLFSPLRVSSCEKKKKKRCTDTKEKNVGYG